MEATFKKHFEASSATLQASLGATCFAIPSFLSLEDLKALQDRDYPTLKKVVLATAFIADTPLDALRFLPEPQLQALQSGAIYGFHFGKWILKQVRCSAKLTCSLLLEEKLDKADTVVKSKGEQAIKTAR